MSLKINMNGQYVGIDDSSITTKKSKVRQLVDIIQSDIKSASSTRKKYSVFVSGGTNLTPVTSSLFQTVFDQDHTLQTSNAMFDMSVGLYEKSVTFVSASNSGTDSSGKILFNNTTLMMREKNDIYKQYAQVILGDSNSMFKVPFDANITSTPTAQVDEAIFININRLFTRDKISKESFAMRLYEKAAIAKNDSNYTADTEVEQNLEANPSVSNVTYTKIYDTGALSSKKVSPIAGEFGTLKNDASTPVDVGLIFYDLGIIVLDAKKVFKSNQVLRGLVSDVTNIAPTTTLPEGNGYSDAITFTKGTSVFSGSFIPEFWRKGSIDDIIDHVCGSRFGTGNLTAFAFKNETTINSSLIFCRAGPSQLNFSTNPTYTDSNGNLRVIVEEDDPTFSYITTVGLYNSSDELLAVAKLSRPVEKNEETDLSIRIRLDY
tara:strand:+ start:12477 stop:13775 length:1299 start_codon:yes stop_codon:yes gene_type:complete